MTLTFEALLEEESLGHYTTLCQATTLADAQSLLTANRVAFLARLKELGVSKVGERQRLANAIGRAQRAGRIEAVAPVPHMRPCTWSQTEETMTVRLTLAAGTASALVGFALDVNSLVVRVGDEHTSASGRLGGLVKPDDSTWELERTPATAQAADDLMAADLMVISLAKATPGAWGRLFHGGASLARPLDEPPTPSRAPAPAPPPPAPSPAAEPAAAPARGPCAFVPRKLQLGGAAVPRAPSARRAPSAPSSSPAAVEACEHWQGEGALLLWRRGASEVTTRPEGPEPEGPLFWWTEDAAAVRVTARTRKGLRAADEAQLVLGERSAALSVDGRPSPWRGALCGRIDVAASGLTVEAAEGEVWDLLTLTLVKTEPRLWLAPWRELQRQQAEEEARRRRLLPARHELLASGAGWECSQTHEAWTVLLPVRDGLVAAADLRVAVRPARRPPHPPHPQSLAPPRPPPRRRPGPPVPPPGAAAGDSSGRILGPGSSRAWHAHEHVHEPVPVPVQVRSDAFNIHLAGQEDTPLLAGELFGRLLPHKCSWRLNPLRDGGTGEQVTKRLAPPPPYGTQPPYQPRSPPPSQSPPSLVGQAEVAVTLYKAEAATWPDLIKTWYT